MDKVKTKKQKMTQIWIDEKVVPVTVLSIDDNEEDALEILEEGEKVTVSGISKGKGFQGAVKRHGFSKGPATHGQKHTLRAPGSAGSTDPQRVMPGQKMPGRMGGKRVTVKNLLVARLDSDNNTVMVKGAVPGSRGTEIEVRIDENKDD